MFESKEDMLEAFAILQEILEHTRKTNYCFFMTDAQIVFESHNDSSSTFVLRELLRQGIIAGRIILDMTKDIVNIVGCDIDLLREQKRKKQPKYNLFSTPRLLDRPSKEKIDPEIETELVFIL